MAELFPYRTKVESLEKRDFLRFSGFFSDILAGAIPASSAIFFVEDSSPFTKIFSKARQVKLIAAAFEEMRKGGPLAMIAGDSILLGFPLAHQGFIAAVVPAVDKVLIDRVAEDWLNDVREAIEQDFIEVKQHYQDPETGLLNSEHLFSVLDSDGCDPEVGLLLVELALPRRAHTDVFRNVQKGAAALSLYSDNRIVLYHLGQSVFCLLIRDKSGILFEQLSSSLVQHLKKEGFSRVHIGTCRYDDLDHGEGDTLHGEYMLDGAWAALKTAGRRGPFSFCDYIRLKNQASHPLRPASVAILRRLQRLSKKDRRFCLLKLSPLVRDVDVTEVLTMVGGEGVYCMIDDDNAIFLYLSGYGPDQAMDYSRELLKRIRGIKGFDNIYGGITSFPYSDFNKSETIKNAQKALLHAAFFGPGHIALFEALSLNVSGDVYFGEGDLPKAVAEYKRGLVCDCNDVNLLNSLGVAYALLNRNSLARQTFERVLEIEEHNYMALYNLGLGAQQKGDHESAIHYFEAAGKYCDESEEAIHVERDLTLQLGMLYCETDRYQESLDALGKWQKKVGDSQHMRIFRYLGEAYLGVGDYREAMAWLQRALQYNEYDGEAMGLLGSAILKLEEGDDIALSLCLKSVELCPDNPALRFRLAEAQLKVGEFREVLRSLKYCNGKAVDKGAVHLLKARTYIALQQTKKAKQWAMEVLHKYPLNSEYYREAEELYRTIS